MKQKGFTLIELLAVIVVLAVIALIAIPVITNVIDKAKVGALKDSAYGILDAGELYIANNLKDGISNNLTFTCSKNKCTSETKEINYKGNINAGTLILTTDSKTLVCVDNGKNYALKLANEKEVTTGIGTCGSYEEANGSFNIVDSLSARIEELEKEVIDLQNQIELNKNKIPDNIIYSVINDGEINKENQNYINIIRSTGWNSQIKYDLSKYNKIIFRGITNHGSTSNNIYYALTDEIGTPTNWILLGTMPATSTTVTNLEINISQEIGEKYIYFKSTSSENVGTRLYGIWME